MNIFKLFSEMFVQILVIISKLLLLKSLTKDCLSHDVSQSNGFVIFSSIKCVYLIMELEYASLKYEEILLKNEGILFVKI